MECWIYVLGYAGNGYCTGNFKEKDTGIADTGTECASDCYTTSTKMRWGYSYCYTDIMGIQWGDCVACESMSFDYSLMWPLKNNCLQAIFLIAEIK